MSKRISYVIGIIIVIMLVYLLSKNFIFDVLMQTLFISLVVAYSLKPFQNLLIQKGLTRKLSAAILVAGLFAIIILMIIFFVPAFFKEVTNIGNSLYKVSYILDDFYKKYKGFAENRYVNEFVQIAISKGEVLIKKFINSMMNGIIEKTGELFSFAVIPIMIYYILADGDILSKTIVNFVPVRSRSVFVNLCRDINNMLSKYIISQFFLSLIVSTLTFILLIILGVNYPLILSILNGIFNIIPYFGPLFGAVPAVIIAFLQSPKTAIVTIIFLNLIQQIEGDIISPKLTGDMVDMHPLYIIVLLIVGERIGGFVGMVLAVPIAVAIKVILEDLENYMY
ncbi:AI-2E family transporter [Clostridium sp. 19966]|uniref:AI-2E family transporter n=1 Tax=Clostridium sp. 19966 TaxID=2768166 RepID=UPI0028DE0BE4|nr:AI-2E family transporter [Clostridium sp. 19966]MDT8718120.1 AI-2E family transporter [Clostridium sp. 19966]